MGMGSSGGGQGGRRPMMSEINVTPMVDVMLVLLIIFMVAAPMMTQGLEVNLPKVDTEALQTEEKQTVVTINAAGQVFLDEIAVSGDDLGFQVKHLMETRGSQILYLRADQAVPYGRVAEMMGKLKSLGVANIGLVTEAEAVAGPGADKAAPVGK